jgi:hypothetical protein
VQLRLSYASLEVQKQLAEQQREDALATVTELEGQLADIGAEIASHMQVRCLWASMNALACPLWCGGFQNWHRGLLFPRGSMMLLCC